MEDQNRITRVLFDPEDQSQRVMMNEVLDLLAHNEEKDSDRDEEPSNAEPMLIHPLTDEEFIELKRRIRAKEASRRYRRRQRELVRCQKREIQQLEFEYKRLQYEQEAVEQSDDVDVQEANNELDERMQETFRGLVRDVTRAWREEHSLVSALSSYLESDRK